MSDTKVETKTILTAKELKSIANKKYYQKHKARHGATKICDICNGKFSYYGRSRHIRSQKHLFCKMLIEQNQKQN